MWLWFMFYVILLIFKKRTSFKALLYKISLKSLIYIKNKLFQNGFVKNVNLIIY